MKTTLDLPEPLVREMKIRAAREGKKLKDVATEVLRRGLSMEEPGLETEGKRVQLPLIECPVAKPEAELGPEEISDLLNAQEANWSVGNVAS